MKRKGRHIDLIHFRGRLFPEERGLIRRAITAVEEGRSFREVPPEFGAPWLVLADPIPDERVSPDPQAPSDGQARAGSLSGFRNRVFMANRLRTNVYLVAWTAETLAQKIQTAFED